MLSRRKREVEKVVEGDLATLVWSELWYAKYKVTNTKTGIKILKRRQ